MTVADLIEILSGLDPDMEVMQFEGMGMWKPLTTHDKLDVYEVVKWPRFNFYSMDPADFVDFKQEKRRLILGIG